MKKIYSKHNSVLTLACYLAMLPLFAFSTQALADCATELAGKYELHPLAKEYAIGGLYREILGQDDLIISNNAEGMSLTNAEGMGVTMAGNIAKLKLADDKNKEIALYVKMELKLVKPILFDDLDEDEIPAELKEGLKQICAVDMITEPESQGNNLMIVSLDMSKVNSNTYEQELETFRRVFPADIEWTNSGPPRSWTIKEFNSFSHFLVWSFSAGRATGGGAIFIPLKKLE